MKLINLTGYDPDEIIEKIHNEIDKCKTDIEKEIKDLNLHKNRRIKQDN